MLITLLGGLAHGFDDDLIEASIDLRHFRWQLKDALRAAAGEHFVKHDTKRVDVCSVVHLSCPLLGSHVFRRAHHQTGGGETGCGGQGPRQTEVGQLGAAILG